MTPGKRAAEEGAALGDATRARRRFGSIRAPATSSAQRKQRKPGQRPERKRAEGRQKPEATASGSLLEGEVAPGAA